MQAPRPQSSARPSRPLKSILKQSSSSFSSTLETAKPPSQLDRTSGSTSLFPTTKKDKRRIKHSALLSKITKSTSKPQRRSRRRPNKQLITTLDALADALPEQEELAVGVGRNVKAASFSAAAGSKVADQVHLISRKSMKSKPGALKRREKIDQGERERFVRNLAQLSGGGGGGGESNNKNGVDKEERADVRQNAGTEQGGVVMGGKTNAAKAPETQQKWAALRGFIAQTLERREDLEHAMG